MVMQQQKILDSLTVSVFFLVATTVLPFLGVENGLQVENGH